MCCRMRHLGMKPEVSVIGFHFIHHIMKALPLYYRSGTITTSTIDVEFVNGHLRYMTVRQWYEAWSIIQCLLDYATLLLMLSLSTRQIKGNKYATQLQRALM